jgi:hypothetical protein
VLVVSSTAARMSADEDRSGRLVFRAWESIPLCLALAAIVIIGFHALSGSDPFDFLGYYRGGERAFATGNPYTLVTWTATPSLALSLGLVSQILTLGQAEWTLTVLNIGIVIGAAVLLEEMLRRRLSGPGARAFLWTIVLLWSVYAPMASSIWWKQFNLLALGLATLGFLALRSERTRSGALLIGLSVALKPLVILLPIALLFWKETRKAAWAAIAVVVGLTAAGPAFLAWRARAFADLNPLRVIDNFSGKTSSLNSPFGCRDPRNISPQAELCRRVGSQYFAEQRAVVLLGVLVLLCVVYFVIRSHAGTSWVVFSFACALSPLMSPIEWPHYQLLLAPMFVLLAVRFFRERASWGYWVPLVVSYLLAAIVWSPASSLPIALANLIGRNTTSAEAPRFLHVAMFAQYLLIATALVWFRSRRATPSHSDDSHQVPRTPKVT